MLDRICYFLFAFALPWMLSSPAAALKTTPEATLVSVPTDISEEITEEPTEDTPTLTHFEDLPGETISATPRLIRAHPATEIFFTDLNQSYVIPKDSKHNPLYYAFEKAMNQKSKLSFRVDPYSRRVLFVDGVAGATAASKKPSKSPAAVNTREAKSGSQ